MVVNGVGDAIKNKGEKFTNFEIDNKKIKIFYNETENCICIRINVVSKFCEVCKNE